MTDTRWTPGPWQWYWRETEGEADCGVFYERHEGQAYSVARCPRYQKRAQWEADAALIAAAPELYAALQWYVDNDDMLDPDANPWHHEGQQRAIAALKKARNE